MFLPGASLHLDLPAHADFRYNREEHSGDFRKLILSSDRTSEVFNKCGFHLWDGSPHDIPYKNLQYKCAVGACPVVCTYFEAGIPKHDNQGLSSHISDI